MVGQRRTMVALLATHNFFYDRKFLAVSEKLLAAKRLDPFEMFL